VRAANQIYAGKDCVQSTGADPVKQSAAPDTSRPELMKMQMPVLKLREPRNLRVAGPADLLKRKNRPRETRFA
jgi:hypothetical protein